MYNKCDFELAYEFGTKWIFFKYQYTIMFRTMTVVSRYVI